MPKVAEFFGIVIYMYFNAQYQNYMATIFIETEEMRGKLPPRAAKMVEEWRQLHVKDLLDNWQSAKLDVLSPIEPLE